MSTALTVSEPKNYPSYTEAENLARRVLARMDSLTAKLRDLESDIRQLWVEFDKLKDGETILGRATKREFCEKKLHRTPRAIQYLLAGQSNPVDRPHKGPSELSSHMPAPGELDAKGPVSKAPGEAAKPHAEKRKNRNDPVDGFEEVRAVSIRMLNIGLREMRKTEANHSLLDSAKTWALCRLADCSRSAA